MATSLSLENCLLELLLNALSSGATAIAVRLDVDKGRIQVVDNGHGISKNALPYVAENKDFKNIETREMCGKSLIEIRRFSSILIIMSRRKNSSDTYGKFFREGKIPEIRKIENRPTCGTTVTVYGSRNSCDWNCEIDSLAIRYMIAYLALVNTQVSFSVRDDARQCILLRIGKNQKIRQLLRVACEHSSSVDQVSRTKISISDKINIVLFWGIEFTNCRKIQQILLNLRPINCPSLRKFMIKIIKNMNDERSDLCLEKIFFLLYVYSPVTEYKFSMKNDRSIVEFYEIDRIVESMCEIMMKNDSRDFQSFRLSNCKAVMPSLIFRSTDRAIGHKRKRSYLTKFSRINFENRRYVGEMKFKVEKPRRMRKSCFSVNENCPAIDNVTGHASSSSENKSHEFIVPAKEASYHDILDVSQISQRCLVKSKKHPEESPTILKNKNQRKNPSMRYHNDSCELSSSTSRMNIEKIQKDPEESLPISQNKNQYQDLTMRNHIENNLEVSSMSQKFIEKSQKHSQDSSPIFQNNNQDKPLSMKNKNYENDDISWISQRCIVRSRNSSSRTSQMCDVKLSDEKWQISPIDEPSQWSNWTYRTETRNAKIAGEPDDPIIYQRFVRFLPSHLHALLPRGNVKLISRDSTQIDKIYIPPNLNLNHRPRDLEVRDCTERIFEFRLKPRSLKSMKILNQVNREFIVASTTQDEKKLLVIIDQHAMHERIRYENLLRAYKRNEKNNEFISVALHRPIVISDYSESSCNLLSKNRQILMRYGLSLSQRRENILLIFTVPRCFVKKTFGTDSAQLEIHVRKLLQEVFQDLTRDGFKKLLPFTIHEAIASEACHGSIKFGDPLTPEQCDILVSCWKKTDAPNRCAHGRPSVIPLLEFSSYKRYHENRNSKQC